MNNWTIGNVLPSFTNDDAIVDSGPLIPNSLRHQMDVVLFLSLVTVVSILGILSNILNIIVYWKQGLKDSITVGLFALSVSDLCVVLCPLFNTIGFVLGYIYPQSPIKFKVVSSVAFLQTRALFYSISSTVTVLLSIERCLCVIRPLKVKQIFTRKRTIILIVIAFLFNTLAWIPKYFAQPLRWQTTQVMNATSRVYTMWYHPLFDSIEAYHNTVMMICMPTTAQTIITVTAIVMTNGLRKASKFRGLATSRKHEDEAQESNYSNLDSSNSIHTKPAAKGKDGAPNNREARLVKTMVILVSLLTMANIPYMGLEYSQLFVPDIRPGKRYENLFWLLLGVSVFLGTINASVNSIVYYSIGSRYRQIVRNMFCTQDTSSS